MRDVLVLGFCVCNIEAAVQCVSKPVQLGHSYTLFLGPTAKTLAQIIY